MAKGGGEMNVYLLYRTDSVGYEEYDAKVIIARTESEARELANVKTADEGPIWNDPTKVTCANLDLHVARVVLESFKAG